MVYHAYMHLLATPFNFHNSNIVNHLYNIVIYTLFDKTYCIHFCSVGLTHFRGMVHMELLHT